MEDQQELQLEPDWWKQVQLAAHRAHAEIHEGVSHANRATGQETRLDHLWHTIANPPRPRRQRRKKPGLFDVMPVNFWIRFKVIEAGRRV